MKSGAGTESVNRLGFPGNEVDPMPADGVMTACHWPAPRWVRGRPGSPQDAAAGCAAALSRFPGHRRFLTCQCGHSPATQPQPHPAGGPALLSPFLANHMLLSFPVTGIFPAHLLVLQQLPHIPTAQRRRPPAEILGVVQGSVGLLEPDYFWSLAVPGPRARCMS